MNILNVAPRFDEATEYSFDFNREIVEEAKKHGHNITDLAVENAIRSKVEEAFSSKNPDLFVFYDHGSEEALLEQDGKGYVIDLDNVDLLSDREVYVMACLWGKIGGLEAYKKNAKAVWAYTEIVSFTTDALLAFQESFNLGFILRLKSGKCMHACWENILKAVKDRMTKLIDTLVDEGKPMAAWCMRSNRDSLVCYNGGSEPPEPKCVFRRLAVKLFGKYGWKIPNPLKALRKFYK